MKLLKACLPLFIGLLAVGNCSFGREWTDSTGTFSVEAELLEMKDGKVRLKRRDGRTITVPLSKLSKKDLEYLVALAKSLEKPPAEEAASNEPVGADLPDLNKAWDLNDLYVVVQWLKEQSKVDKSKLPRSNSALLRKVLAPTTIQSVIQAEDNVKQLATAPSAQTQYHQIYQVYSFAGLDAYLKEAAALLKAHQQVRWATLEKFHKSLATRAALARSFDQSAQYFCTMVLRDAAYAREKFPTNYATDFQTNAVKYYPQAFRMQSEKSRAQAAEFFFQYRAGTEKQLNHVNPSVRASVLQQKQMVDQIEAAIRANIPQDVPRP